MFAPIEDDRHLEVRYKLMAYHTRRAEEYENEGEVELALSFMERALEIEQTIKDYENK